jgi:hypothetical protein
LPINRKKKNFFDKSNFSKERQEFQTAIDVINNDLEFRATRLWILIFAFILFSGISSKQRN